MRKIASILLVSILLFNWFGYQLLSCFLQNRVTIYLDARLDREEYNNNDLVEIKMPVALPYQISHDNFERCYGEIEMNGVHYTYVKRRVFNDSLTLLCLPNYEKTKIADAGSDFFKLVNGLQTTPSGNREKSSTTVFKHLLAEYLSVEDRWSAGYCNLINGITFPVSKFFYSHASFTTLPEVPPENASMI